MQQLACTIFCSCQGSKECFKAHTTQAEIELDEDDEDDDDYNRVY